MRGQQSSQAAGSKRADTHSPPRQQHAGFVNDKAVAISAEGDKGVSFQSKKAKSVHQPAKAGHKTTFGGHNRKYVLRPYLSSYPYGISASTSRKVLILGTKVC